MYVSDTCVLIREWLDVAVMDGINLSVHHNDIKALTNQQPHSLCLPGLFLSMVSQSVSG